MLESGSGTERGFPPLVLPYIKMNGYCHHQIRASNLSKCCYYQFDSYKFGAMSFNDNSACSNSCCSKQNTILHKTSAKK